MVTTPVEPPVTAPPHDGESELAERLLWWLAVGGVTLGIIDLALLIAELGVRPSWPSWLRIRITSLYWGVDWTEKMGLAQICLFCVQPVLLILGSLALWRRRAWAKQVLLVYVGLRFATILLSIALMLYRFWGEDSPWSLQLGLVRTVPEIHVRLVNCVFAVVLLVCLTRLRLPEHARRAGGGFEPVMRSGQGG